MTCCPFKFRIIVDGLKRGLGSIFKTEVLEGGGGGVFFKKVKIIVGGVFSKTNNHFLKHFLWKSP